MMGEDEAGTAKSVRESREASTTSGQTWRPVSIGKGFGTNPNKSILSMGSPRA